MNNFSQPYVIRRVFYAVVALIGAALFGFGVGDAAQIDQWTDAAEKLLAPLLVIVSSGLAGVKANPGSDVKLKPAPAPDPAPAPTPVVPNAPDYLSGGNDLLAQMREQIKENRG